MVSTDREWLHRVGKPTLSGQTRIDGGCADFRTFPPSLLNGELHYDPFQKFGPTYEIEAPAAPGISEVAS
jgi:hypothetical protein